MFYRSYILNFMFICRFTHCFLNKKCHHLKTLFLNGWKTCRISHNNNLINWMPFWMYWNVSGFCFSAFCLDSCHIFIDLLNCYLGKLDFKLEINHFYPVDNRRITEFIQFTSHRCVLSYTLCNVRAQIQLFQRASS